MDSSFIVNMYPVASSIIPAVNKIEPSQKTNALQHVYTGPGQLNNNAIICLEAFRENFIYFQSFFKKLAEEKSPKEICFRIFLSLSYLRS